MGRRLYLPLDVDFFRDEAVTAAREASPWAELLFVHLCCEAKDRETDGRISPSIAAVALVPNWRKWITVLVDVGLLVVDGDGWLIRSFTKKNLSAAQIAERRAGTAERVRKHREKRPSNTAGNALPLSTKHEARSKTTPTPSTTSTEPLAAESGGGFLPETKAAIRLLADIEFKASPVPIGSRSAWLQAVQRRIADERGAELEAAVNHLRRYGDLASPDAVIAEADRHKRTTTLEPGARSWGKSRADLTLYDVALKAHEQWPDDPELRTAAIDAWQSAQNQQEEVA